MQRRGDTDKIQGGYIPFSAFDTPKVGAVHPNLSGKSFLRVALAGQTPAAVYGAGQPADMVGKAHALPTSPQA